MKKNQTLLKGGTIVTHLGFLRADILIEGKLIIKIAENISANPADAVIIKCYGMLIFPGLIDGQVHFRDELQDYKATIFSETRAAAAGGVTSYIEQPNTNPAVTTIARLYERLKLAKQTSLINYSCNLGATNENLPELQLAIEMHRDRIPGIKVFMGSSTGNMLVDNRSVLEGIFKLGKLVITHCEDEKMIKFNENLYAEKDEILMSDHPLIRPMEACLKSSSLAFSLAKEFGTHLLIYHISTAEELKLFDFATPIMEKRIFMELCVHHPWFNADDYERLGSWIKCNPAIKDARHQQALLKALVDTDVINTDHAPHTVEEKALPYFKCPSGLPLVQHRLDMLCEWQRKGYMTYPQIAEKTSRNQAYIFGIRDRGEIKEGYYADIAIYDPRIKWNVGKKNIHYKCGWSPLEGHSFKGKVMMTIVNGTIVYHDDVTEVSPLFPSFESPAMELVFSR